MIGGITNKEDPICKYYSVILFQNHLRNAEMQMNRFEGPKIVKYSEKGGSQTGLPAFERYAGYYGCISKNYATDSSVSMDLRSWKSFASSTKSL